MDLDFSDALDRDGLDLNHLEREWYARDIPIENEQERVNLDINLREIFPDVDVLYEIYASRNRQQFFSYTGRIPTAEEKDIITQFEKDEIPKELEFF